MNEKAIGNRLVEQGKKLFNEPQRLFHFTNLVEADALIKNLATCPHAFVLACIMDRQVRTEQAWKVPYEISQKLGGFSMESLGQLSPADVKRLMSQPRPLHRYADIMSDLFWKAVQRIRKQYDGDASRIWTGNPTSAEVVYRLLQFEGVGPKIATMAANILARDFKIPFADHYSIDVSADVHVRRVFGRLELCDRNPSVEQVIYKARALHPEFPGIMDLTCWEIGRNWCKPGVPECKACSMEDLCPSAHQEYPMSTHHTSP